jgi:hypothetical protein
MALATSTYLAIAAVAVGGATSYQSQQQAKSAAKKQKEAGKVSAAEQAAQQTAQTRAQIREERVRRAQILQSSENTGVSGSSGALGSIGALQTSIGSNLASASRQANSAQAITGLTQKAADYEAKARETQAIGGLAVKGLQIGGDLFAASPPTPPPQNIQPGGFSPATQPNPYDNLFRNR